MMTYKGKSFCRAKFICKKNVGCDRILTAKMQREADKLKLLVSYQQIFDCYEKKDK